MHHSGEITAVVVLCLALGVGAAARVLSQRTRFPYTVAMLLAGVALGLMVPRLMPHNELMLEVVSGSGIQPDLLLFVFLPALVFESAFALDTHAFAKHVGFVLLLAVPALVVTTLLMAIWMVGLTEGSWQWGWPVALAFGALISATDPIAVVAILRDVGAPKRLALWIEGESLLNDGTAIVAFTILFALVTGGAQEVSPGSVLVEFMRVAGGGVLVGTLAGFVTATWIGRSFEDPMVEVTLTLVVGFLAMLTAEHFLHVSGVLAVVTAGLYLAGPGHTRISPAVQPVLHAFWELLAYIANTVIFLLVGFVIAENLDHASLTTVWVVLGGFAGVVVVRIAVTYAARSIGNFWVRPPVDAREAAVMSWGGLRGAVSLALALLVSQHAELDEDLRRQFLQATAGIVLLTILVCGATTRGVLTRLGFTKLTAAEKLSDARAKVWTLNSVQEHVEEASQSPALRALPWADVRDSLSQRSDLAGTALKQARESFGETSNDVRGVSAWRRAIAIERRFHADAFREGTLGARALEVLNRDLDVHLDLLETGVLKPPQTRSHGSPLDDWISPLARRLGMGFGRVAFAGLALRYDLARAQAAASDQVRLNVQWGDLVSSELVEEIDAVYARYQRDARARLEDLRVNLPEVATAIERRLATRLVLNYERAAYKRLASRGELDLAGLERAMSEVDARLKRLFYERTRAELVDLVSLVRNAPLFRQLDDTSLQRLGALMRESTLSPGQWLFREGEMGDAMYLVARGLVDVVREPKDGSEQLIAVIGGGDILGEMALLDDAPRTAGARAASTVTIGRIAQKDFLELVESIPGLADAVWEAVGRRHLDNTLRENHGFEAVPRKHMVQGATFQRLAEAGSLEPSGRALFVVHGAVEHEGETHPSGTFLLPTSTVVHRGQARVLHVPTHDEALRETSRASA